MMKSLLLFLISVGILSIAARADAQLCYSSPVPIVRYNMIPSPVYRHYEDSRRYNSAPSRYGYAAPVPTVSVSSHYHQAQSCAPVVKVCTEIVSQRCEHVYTYDSCGRRISQNVTVTIYKDIYSNGGCRIWQHVSY